MKLIPGKTYTIFLTKEFLKVFLVSVIFIMGLSFIVRTLQQTSTNRQYTLLQMLILRILEAPEIISRECLLASSMFAAVYTMSTLSKNREIIALRSCGVSVYHILLPIIILGFILAVFSLLFENYIVIPSEPYKKNYLSKTRGQQQSVTYLRDRHDLIVFGERGIIYKIALYHAQTHTMENLLLLRKDQTGNIITRIDAASGKWDGTQWVFFSGVYRKFNDNGSLIREHSFKMLKSNIHDNPKYFARNVRSIDNMTLKEGFQYVKTIKKMGLPYKGAETKFHRKIARSMSLFLVIIIGVTLGSMPFKNALVISFSFTLGMVLVFFFILEIGSTLGGSGKLPPFIGGWLSDIVFSIISIYLLKRTRI